LIAIKLKTNVVPLGCIHPSFSRELVHPAVMKLHERSSEHLEYIFTFMESARPSPLDLFVLLSHRGWDWSLWMGLPRASEPMMHMTRGKIPIWTCFSKRIGTKAGGKERLSLQRPQAPPNSLKSP
jgi:hypothetical protein